MRIWNPTQVNISDRATRLMGRAAIMDGTVPATVATVIPTDANPGAMPTPGLLVAAVPLVTQGAGGVRVGAVGDGAPKRSLGIGSVLDADPYSDYSFITSRSLAAGGAGQNPAVKLENPAGSGKTLVVERIYAAVSQSKVITINLGAVHEAGDGNSALNAAWNRHLGSVGAPVALLHSIANSAIVGTSIFTWYLAQANIPYMFDVPLRIDAAANYGIAVIELGSVGADTISIDFAWREE